MNNIETLSYTDKLLDDIAAICIKQFHPIIKNKLKVTKWRWDVPSLSFSWVFNNQVNANINILVVGDGSAYLQVEGNLWVDREDNGNLVRHWVHCPESEFLFSQCGSLAPNAEEALVSTIKNISTQAISASMETIQAEGKKVNLPRFSPRMVE